MLRQNSQTNNKLFAQDELALRAAVAGLDSLMSCESSYRFDERLSVGYYWRESEDRIEPLNHVAVMAEAFLFGSFVICSEYINSRLSHIYEFIVSCLYFDDNDTLVWNYRPKPGNPKASSSEPIWKGFITSRFIYHSSRFGYSESIKYRDLISDSLVTNVYFNLKNSVSECNSIISASRKSINSDPRVNKNRSVQDLLAYGFLAQYSPSLMAEIEALAGIVGDRFWFEHNPNLFSYSVLLR
jgi:hypothetical protein